MLAAIESRENYTFVFLNVKLLAFLFNDARPCMPVKLPPCWAEGFFWPLLFSSQPAGLTESNECPLLLGF